MSARVFAYGSNMCSRRLRDYYVCPQGPGLPAVLKGYRLRFNKRSTEDHSGKANIELHDGAEVWGVLYDIHNSDLPKLDLGEGTGYARQDVTVYTAQGAMGECWVYVARTPDPDSALRPYSWYKRFIVEGAKEHGLPQAYVETLQAIDAIEDPDRNRDRSKRESRCRDGGPGSGTVR